MGNSLMNQSYNFQLCYRLYLTHIIVLNQVHVTRMFQAAFCQQDLES